MTIKVTDISQLAATATAPETTSLMMEVLPKGNDKPYKFFTRFKTQSGFKVAVEMDDVLFKSEGTCFSPGISPSTDTVKQCTVNVESENTNGRVFRIHVPKLDWHVPFIGSPHENNF